MIYGYMRRQGPMRPRVEPPPNLPAYWNDGKRVFQRRKAWVALGSQWQSLNVIEHRNVLTSVLRVRFEKFEGIWVEHKKRKGLVSVDLVGAVILTHDNRGGFLYARPKN